MPFVQMENISLFLWACKTPPLNLQEHDIFLTVDLYESKDPAQVIQCLVAFSRAAHSINPAAFPSAIGQQSRLISPQSMGGLGPSLKHRGYSGASNALNSTIEMETLTPLASLETENSSSGEWSTKNSSKNDINYKTVLSSWSKREHKDTISPAWNIAQYGYLGGASQANLGIAFGSRRQIISTGPTFPILTDKSKKQCEKKADENLRVENQKRESKRPAQIEPQIEIEDYLCIGEERTLENKASQACREELRMQEEEKRIWEEQERQWKLTEDNRRREEKEAEARMDEERRRARSRSREPNLQGQILSQFQDGNVISANRSNYSSRAREFENELKLARQREAEYQALRQNPGNRSLSKLRMVSPSRPKLPARMDSWSKDEREVLRTPHHTSSAEKEFQYPFFQQPILPKKSRPLPDPTAIAPLLHFEVQQTGQNHPMPDRTTTSPIKTESYHIDSRPLPKVPAPQPLSRQVQSHLHQESFPPLQNLPSVQPSFRQDLMSSRPQPPTPTKSDSFILPRNFPKSLHSLDYGQPGFLNRGRNGNSQQCQGTLVNSGPNTLLEREMEMERQRQKEWEEIQMEKKPHARLANEMVEGINDYNGRYWDVNQRPRFTDEDNHNSRTGRQQIVGPRPLPSQR